MHVYCLGTGVDWKDLQAGRRHPRLDGLEIWDSGLGFAIQGLGFKFDGLGFKVEGLGGSV